VRSSRGGRGSRLRPAGLATRLFVAQLLVVVTGAVTLWLVAAAVGPPIFRNHLDRAGVNVAPETTGHVEDAFISASAVSITVAVLAALLAALAVSVYVSRRIAGPVGALAEAAEQVAGGEYAVRVPAPRMGTELGTLAASFNVMASRLEATETTRRRLLADLAHEMRTPVATLDAYVEGLEDGVATLDADTAAVLRAQTSRLARLADDVAAISRAEENRLDLHPTASEPRQLVTAAIKAASELYAAKGVALAADAASGLPMVVVDRDRLGQALGNLLDNALRHTPVGGTVTIGARPANGGYVELFVSDTGAGIPAEHLPRVFERFYRVDQARDRAHGGSGIGLAIAKALVEAHGGRISVTSSGPGTGSTFVIRLPAAAGAR